MCVCACTDSRLAHTIMLRDYPKITTKNLMFGMLMTQFYQSRTYTPSCIINIVFYYLPSKADLSRDYPVIAAGFGDPHDPTEKTQVCYLKLQGLNSSMSTFQGRTRKCFHCGIQCQSHCVDHFALATHFFLIQIMVNPIKKCNLKKFVVVTYKV